MQAVTVQDALTDPHLTIEKYTDPLYKDPGHQELRKRTTISHDTKSKIFRDYKNKRLCKLSNGNY
jgi:hypothetical protein